jgi:hypothetical protein
MLKLFKTTQPKGHRQHSCPDCGCDLRSGHWQRCPRCQRELDPGSGCQNCGRCKH